ncbi:glycosyltransferase family 2 protein, partial [Amylibacter sp.]|nr:glycosyltransferase family 2 protein [Amylibacter sp.]
MGKFETIIIIPAYNEENSLLTILSDLEGYQIVLVDDASTDNTIKIAHSFPNVVTLKNKTNCGYEKSIMRGIRYAIQLYGNKCQNLLTIDADGELPVNQIPNFLANSSKYNILIGRRNSFNRFSEVIAGYYARLVYGIADPFCGMRLININAAKQFIASGYHYNLGFGILKFSRAMGTSISCVPISVGKREGRSRFGYG